MAQHRLTFAPAPHSPRIPGTAVAVTVTVNLEAISPRDAFEEFLLDRRGHVKPRTVEFYRRTLEPFVAWLEAAGVATVNDVTPPILRRFNEHLAGVALERGWRAGGGGIHAHARARRVLLRFAEREHWLVPGSLDLKPAAYRDKHRPCFTSDDLERMITDCSGRRRYSLEGRRDLALVLLLADSGIRRAEAVSLNWGDVDLATGSIRVRQGKGDKARSVYVGPTALRAIRRYRRQVGHEPGDPLLQGRVSGRRLAASSLREVLRRLGARVELPDLSSHQFRRYFASSALRAGMDLLHVQRLMGHSTVAMTAEYIGITAVEMQRAHLAASPVEALRQRRDR